MRSLFARLKVVNKRSRGKLYICYGPHPNDVIYAENLLAFFRDTEVRTETIKLNSKNPQRKLRRCLNDSAIGVIGLNVQLDNSWIDSDNFLDLAAAAGVPVLHWVLDHTSTRWREFTKATSQNSRFLFLSPFAEQYFRRYALPDSLTACTVNTGPSPRSRIELLTQEAFLAREIACIVPINLRRVSGTMEDAMRRRQGLDPKIRGSVDIACETAYFDLDGPLERHLEAALEDAGLDLTNGAFNDAFQIVEDVVQIRRRQRIFEIAREFPVLIQSDASAAPIVAGGKARFEANVTIQATLARMKGARAVLSASRVNDEIHNRIQNGLNAGCVNIVEDNAIHRTVLANNETALFFDYQNDSLRECLDLVCSNPFRAYQLAQAGFALRDQQPFRFGGFHNIIDLARMPTLASAKCETSVV
jgi:hypothetical protein